jgi:hypothetical protein
VQNGWPLAPLVFSASKETNPAGDLVLRMMCFKDSALKLLGNTHTALQKSLLLTWVYIIVPNVELGFGVQKLKPPLAKLMIWLPVCKSEGITENPVNARQTIVPKISRFLSNVGHVR